MPSFDIVSEVDSNEIRHAVENANRELATRYDFRGIEAIFSLQDDIVTLTAQADMQCQQMLDILRRCLSKRSVDANALKVDTDALRSGKSFAIKVSFKQGV